MYSIFADDICIYNDISTLDSLNVISPKLVLEDSAAGSLNMSLPTINPGYDYIIRMDTDISVKRDGEEIWAGRVLTEDKDFWNNRIFYCEGELAFLNDTTQPPAEYHDTTVRGFLTALIDNHNAKAPENRRFVVGVVTVTDPNDSLYRYTNYEKTLECINNKLVNRLGGHIRIRKVNGVRYIDYLADYPNTNTQTIEFGKNLMDFVRSWDMTEYATVIVPLGARLEESPIAALEAYLTVESVNDGSIYIQSDEAVREHGWIEKVVNWDDVTVPSNLKRKAVQYLTDLQFDNMSIELSALDMHYYNVSYEAVKLLDKIRVISRPHGMDRFFPVAKLNIPLDSPENTVFTLGDTISPSLTSTNNKTSAGILQRIENLPKKQEMLEEAKANATAIMTMATNGYITITQDENGSNSLYVTDTQDYKTATRMWLLNMNGFGYSKDGGKTFGLAITMDGAIVADYITAGTLNGEIIRAGTIKTAAISQEFKNYISDEIGDTREIVTQEFKAADGELLSQITQDISASETRSRTLIRQTEDTIEARAELKYSTKEDIQSLEQLFMTYVDFEDSDGNKILDNKGNVITTRTTADGITAVEVQSMIKTSADNVKLEVMETVDSHYTTIEQHDSLNGKVTTLRGEYDATKKTVSEISTNVGSIKLMVEEDYTLKSDFRTLDGKVSNLSTNLSNNYYTKSQIDVTTNGIKQSVEKTTSTANEAKSATASINTYISNTLEPKIELRITKDDVVSAINMSTQRITLSTTGRLVITSGNFKLDASGNITAANATLTSATMTGSITSGGTSGYRTKISSGQMETFYDNKRVSVIVPTYTKSSGIVRTGILASTNYHGLMLGRVYNDEITGYYYISLDGDGYDQFGCRHYFIGDVKFVSGYFKANVNFADNYGISWGGNTGLRYANSGVSRTGVWLGISNTPTILTGNEIHTNVKLLLHGVLGGMTDSSTYQDIVVHSSSGIWIGNTGHKLYLRGSNIYTSGRVANNMDFEDNCGLSWGGNIGLRYYNGGSPTGVWVGIYDCPTVLTGSEIRCRARLYLSGGSEVTSDRRKKNSIKAVDSRYTDLLDLLDAKLFKYNEYRKDTLNCGFIAQEVFEAMKKAGIQPDEFGAFDDLNGDGSEYALDYMQFIAVLWEIAKQLKRRVEVLERSA